MNDYQPLNQLPPDIQNDWGARLTPADPTGIGAFHLVAIRRTEPKSFESQRVTVLVLDENGIALPGVPVAFSYSTANKYALTPDFLWSPPPPQRAFIAPTTGAGQIDQIQNEGVKENEPGGITVYILTPEYSSDVVSGVGMLADHTGLVLTFQRVRVGYVSTEARLSELEAQVTNLQHDQAALSKRVKTLEFQLTTQVGSPKIEKNF